MRQATFCLSSSEWNAATAGLTSIWGGLFRFSRSCLAASEAISLHWLATTADKATPPKSGGEPR